MLVVQHYASLRVSQEALNCLSQDVQAERFSYVSVSTHLLAKFHVEFLA